MLPKFSKEKWMILFAMSTALAMVFLDSTIIPVALPTIQRELNVSPSILQWIVNAYFLANAAVVMAGGKASDYFGHRKIFLLGLFVFGIASAIGGMAMNEGALVASRSVQGIGAGLMTPAAFSILTQYFPRSEQGRAIGFSVSVSSIFLSLGPFLGGFITEYISWRWIFWINLFIGGWGVLMTLRHVPELPPLKKEKFDFLGLICMMAFLGTLTIALMEAPNYGWVSVATITLFCAAAFLGLCLYLLYRRAEEPFFDFALFKYPRFLTGNLTALFIQFLLMAPVFWAVYFQKVMGASPFLAGVWTATSTIPIFFSSFIAGNILDKRGPKGVVTVGGILIIISLIGFYFFVVSNSLTILIISLVIFGIGISSVLTPTGATTLNATPLEKRGLASGIYNTIRFTGATLGIAILGSVSNQVKQSDLDQFISEHHLELTKSERKKMRKIYYGSGPRKKVPQKVAEYAPKLRALSITAARKAIRIETAIVIGIAFASLLLTIYSFRGYRYKQTK